MPEPRLLFMNIQVLLLLLAGVYIVSIIACYAVSLQAMRSWHSAFWRQTPVSRLAAWHPILADHEFLEGIPTRAGDDEDWKTIQRWCLLPVLNLALALGVPLAAFADAMLSRFMSVLSVLTGGEGQHQNS